MGSQVADLMAAEAKASGSEKAALVRQRQEIEAKIDAITMHANVYARAKPLDKITIVRSLQRQGSCETHNFPPPTYAHVHSALCSCSCQATFAQ